MGNWSQKYDPTARVVGTPPPEPAAAEPPALGIPIQGGSLINYSSRRAANAQPEAPQDPAGELGSYGSYANYNTAIQQQTGMGKTAPPANPLLGHQPTVVAGGASYGQDLVRDPFNPNGPPISRDQYTTLQGQMAITHTPGSQAMGQKYGEKLVAGMAGGTGFEPIPLKTMLTGNAPAHDDVFYEDPSSVAPEAKLKYKEDGQKIRERFSNMMTRNRGDLTMKQLEKMGDTLIGQFPSHPRFIANMVEEFTKTSNNTTLRQELQDQRLGVPDSMQGNEFFQALPPADQMMISQGLRMAQSEGFMLPGMMQAMQFEENAKEALGPRFIIREGESNRGVTTEDITRRAEAMYGLSGGGLPGQEAQPAAPEPFQGMITNQAGQQLGAVSTPNIPGVQEMRQTIQGTEMVFKNGEVLKKSDAQDFINEMMKSGEPSLQEMAGQIMDAFGLREGPEDPIGTVERMARLNKIEDLKKAIKEYEDSVDPKKRKQRNIQSMNIAIPT